MQLESESISAITTSIVEPAGERRQRKRVVLCLCPSARFTERLKFAAALTGQHRPGFDTEAVAAKAADRLRHEQSGELSEQDPGPDHPA